MHVTACQLELRLPGCQSLKEKRGRLKPLLSHLQSRFGLSAAEVDGQDAHTRSVVACAVVSTSEAHNERVFQTVVRWVEAHCPDIEVQDFQIEAR